jgi:hypothetical protein
MAGTRRVSLREVSKILGVSLEDGRKRVKRGSLESDEDPDERVYVCLDYWGDTSYPEPEVENSEKVEMVEELRDRVRFLERQLEQANERDRENRCIVAALTSRIPELEPPREAPEAPETVEEEPERAESHPAAGEAQATTEHQ